MSPEVFQRVLDAGQARIAAMLAEKPVDADGMVRLPFRCWGCDRLRYDFALVNGDGIPMCHGCVDGVWIGAIGDQA